MKIKLFARKKVLTAGVFVMILLGIMTIFIVKQPDGKKEENDEKELPPKIKAEIEHLFLEPEVIVKNDIRISRWSVDKDNKRINIFVWELNAENKKFDGKKIDGWTINVIEDVELKEEIEKLDAEIKKRLKDTSASWIGSVDPRTGSKTAEIWVHNLTPESQKLHNTTLYGWKIYVWKSLDSPKETALRDPRIKEMIRGNG